MRTENDTILNFQTVSYKMGLLGKYTTKIITVTEPRNMLKARISEEVENHRKFRGKGCKRVTTATCCQSVVKIR